MAQSREITPSPLVGKDRRAQRHQQLRKPYHSPPGGNSRCRMTKISSYSPPLCVLATAEPVAVILTDAGHIHMDVLVDQAPISAGSLAHVDAGLLDNAGFYRTVNPANDHGSPKISVIQGGVSLRAARDYVRGARNHRTNRRNPARGWRGFIGSGAVLRLRWHLFCSALTTPRWTRAEVAGNPRRSGFVAFCPLRDRMTSFIKSTASQTAPAGQDAPTPPARSSTAGADPLGAAKGLKRT